MQEPVYKIAEIVGTSGSSVEKAIENALTRAAGTLRNIRWFEVVQTRGSIGTGQQIQYQVLLKIGFALETLPVDPPFNIDLP
jgi:flavin-binding protein dodecin